MNPDVSDRPETAPRQRLPPQSAAATDRCRLPRAFWDALRQLGLRPAAVLRQARLPAALHLDETATISPVQLHAIWTAVEALSNDPAVAIRMVRDTRTERHELAFLAALYAADFRDGLFRLVRFKRLCSPERMRLEEQDGLASLLIDWPTGRPHEPALAIDATFAMALELGRRGTGRKISAVTVDYARQGRVADEHSAFFGCPIRFGAERNRLVLQSHDLDRPFPGHNPELLAMLAPGMAAALADIDAPANVSEQVKVLIKRALPSGRSEVAAIAKDLGLSERTLQRRVMAEGSSFRTLLMEARRELAQQLLLDRALHIDEVAQLVGYEDRNAFSRAFRQWEAQSPAGWRRSKLGHGPSKPF